MTSNEDVLQITAINHKKVDRKTNL